MKFEQIALGYVTDQEPEWKTIKNEAKIFIKKNMLIVFLRSKGSRGHFKRSTSYFSGSNSLAPASMTAQVSLILSLKYVELLLSSFNLRQMLNKDKLRAVFKMFDGEGAGAATIDQIRVGLRLNGAN